MLTLFISMVEKALNKYIQCDPTINKKLKRLAGKALAIQVSDLKLTFYLTIKAEKIRVSEHPPEKIDTIIHGNSFALFRLSRVKQITASHLNSGIKIEGDLELGQNIKALFNELEIDWEEHLSHYLGDIMAHRLYTTLGKLKKLGHNMKERVCMDLEDFVRDEMRLFPHRIEVEDFFSAVSELQMAADRLQAKYNRLLERES